MNMLEGAKIKTLLVLLLLAGVVLFWRGLQLREENKVLSARIAEVQKLSDQSEGITQLRAVEAQIEEFNQANKDVFKLRNEVTQLRRQKQEAEKLLIENQELERKVAERNASKSDESLPSNFVPRSSLIDAGFATPEAALQTFFRSLVTEDYKRFNQCLLQPEESEPFDPESAEAYRFREAIKLWKNFPGYFIAETELLASDRVLFQTKTSVGGRALPITLQRLNNEWKIADLLK